MHWSSYLENSIMISGIISSYLAPMSKYMQPVCAWEGAGDREVEGGTVYKLKAPTKFKIAHREGGGG